MGSRPNPHTSHATSPCHRYAEIDVEAPVAAHRGWCAILRQLRRMCADARSEVRTCAMHTLTNLLTSHGATLGGATWDFALWHALLPLMGELTAAAAAANATAPVAQTLGKEGGRPVLMLLHHSRDTASKQWDETWVLALTAFARLFRSFLPLLQPRPAFDAAWGRLLAFLRESLLAAPRSPEIAHGAVAAVHALLLSAVRKPQRTAADAARKDAVVERLPRALWAGVWGVVEGAVDEAVDEYAAHEKMLCRLLAHFLEAYDGARDCFEEADVLRLLQIAGKLAAPPGVRVGWEPLAPAAKPSEVQVELLKLLAGLVPLPAGVSGAMLWPLLIWQLLKFVQPTLAPSDAAAAADAAPPDPGAAKKPPREVFGGGFAQRALTLLLDQLTAQREPAAQLAVFEDVMQVLRAALLWRRSPRCKCPALPLAVARALPPLLTSLLPLLPKVGAPQQAELVATVSTFLAPPEGGGAADGDGGGGGDGSSPSKTAVAKPLRDDGSDEPPLPPSLSEEEAELERALLATLPAVLRAAGFHMPAPLRVRLLRAVHAPLTLPPAAAAARDAAWRDAAAALCAVAGDRTGLSDEGEAPADATCVLAAELLASSSKELLLGWAHASDDAGAAVVGPRAAQLLYLLRALRALKLPAGALSTGAKSGSRLGKALRGPHAHLIRLAPALIECVGRGEGAEAKELQGEVRELLHVVAKESGLE